MYKAVPEEIHIGGAHNTVHTGLESRGRLVPDITCDGIAHGTDGVEGYPERENDKQVVAQEPDV